MTSPSPTPPDRSTVARLLARLDRPTFGQFVADLWTYRGRQARFDGDVVRVTDTRDGERLLLIVHGGDGLLDRSRPDLPQGVDSADVAAVVSNTVGSSAASRLAARANARLLDPTALRRMALYAVDRESCDALFERYFGRGLDDLAPRTRESTTGPFALLSGTQRSLPVGAAVAVVMLFVVLTASVTGTTLTGLAGVGQSDPATAPTARPTALPTSTPTPEPTPDRSLGCHPTPRAGVEATLSALAANNPETNDGIRRVWNGATPEFRRYSGPFETFVTILNNYPFVGLLDPATIEYGNATQAGRTARQTFTLTSSDGSRFVYTFTFVLEDPDSQGCWSLSGLTYRSPSGSADTTPTDTPSSPTTESTTAAVSTELTNV